MATVQDSDEEVQHKKKAKGHRIIDSGKNVSEAPTPKSSPKLNFYFWWLLLPRLIFYCLGSWTLTPVA